MTGEDVEVVRRYLADSADLESRVTALTSSLERAHPLGETVAPSLPHAHDVALASVVRFVTAAERSVRELRGALER